MEKQDSSSSPGGPISRRDFLVRGAAATGALRAVSLFGQNAGAGLGDRRAASRRVLHIISYSHIDAAWLWPWRDASNVALTTARSALDRMNETPGFHYSHSSASHYRWIEQADPGMFQEIRRRIREGRWEVVGGWPVEPDCTIPATESFVRHSLYGKRYCRTALGVDVKIGFNPDSFGHGFGLPTLLKGAGYGYYVFMKPQEEEMKLPLLFWWEGPDGSRVLALRIFRSYDSAAARIPVVAESSFAPGFNHAAFFLGVGDHGGAVTRAQIEEVLRYQRDPDLPELRWSTVGQFFQAIESSPGIGRLPVIRGELEHNRRGTYSACGEEKYNNRRAERALVKSESLALLCHLDANRPYPRQELEDAWWIVLFNQFHDLLAGTAIYADYEDARDGLGSACQTANTEKIRALEILAREVDMSAAPEGAVFVFNPLPWRRTALLEYHFNDTHGRPRITHLEDRDGARIPIQMRVPDSMTNAFPRVNALVDLPAFGYRVFNEVTAQPAPPGQFGRFAAVGENTFSLSSLKAADGAELLASSLGLVAISDTGNTWGRDVDQFRQELGRPRLRWTKLVDDGPVLRVTRQIFEWGTSTITVETALFSGLDIVRLQFVIDWHEHQQILKLEIPTALAEPRVFAMVPGAVIERPVDGHEEPYQDWIAVQGKIEGRAYTVGLMNNCTYSYDCLGGKLRTVLVRAVPYARQRFAPLLENDLSAWQDQGRQERLFWLVGRQGEYQDLRLDRLADAVQSPAEYVLDSRHAGSRAWEDSFLEITPDTVSVLSIKRAEEANGTVVVRVQERSGKPNEVRLRSKLLRLDHRVPLAPWEIKTLRVDRLHPDRVRTVSLMET